MTRLITALLAAVISCCAPGLAHAETSYEFADWTDVSGGVAHGTLNGGSVSLSGTKVDSPPAGTVNGAEHLWNRSDFTPPLPSSDAISFVGGASNTYVLSFGVPQINPVLDFGSIASTLTFPSGTQITRLSGDAQFSVVDNQVIGGLDLPTDDGNGSVRLQGTFTSIPFTASFAGTDGIYLQAGVILPPETTITSGPGGPIWNMVSQFTFTSSAAGSTFECSLDGGPWTSCSAPYTTPTLSSGRHQFSVRATGPEGIVDPTPAVREFEVNQPEDVTTPTCEVTPVLYWLWTFRSDANDRWACIIGEQNISCPQFHVCKWTTERCPVGARCTVSTRAEWSDSDSNINHGAFAVAMFGPSSPVVQSSFGPYVHNARPDQEASCGVHSGHSCTATATTVGLDDAVLFGACSWRPGTLPLASSPGAVQLGPDSERTLRCFVDMHVEPAPVFAPVQEVGQYATVYTPSAGALTIHPMPTPAFAAVKRQRPAIAPVTVNVAQAGPVKFKLRLNPAAKRLLARRHALPLTMHMTFTPVSGATVTSSPRFVLQARAPVPQKRCRIGKPKRQPMRLPKVCRTRH